MTPTTNSESEGVLILNEKGTIILINPSANELFGYDEDKLLNLSIETILEKGNQLIKQHDKLLKNNKLSDGLKKKVKGIKKDKSEVQVKVSVSQFEGGKEVFTVFFVSDAGLTKEETEKLTPVIFLILDQELNISLINTYGSTLLGSVEGSLKGLNWFENFLPLNYTEQVQSIFNKAVIKGVIDNYETPVLTLNGERFTIKWTSRVIYGSSGEVVATLSTGVDSGKKEDLEIDLHHMDRIKKLKQRVQDHVTKQNIELLYFLDLTKKANQDLQSQIQERIGIEKNLLKIQRLYDKIIHHFPEGVIGVINRDMKYVLLDGKEMNDIDLPSIGINKLGSTKINNATTIGDETLEKLMQVFDGKSVSFEVKTGDQFYTIAGEPLRDSQNNINEILCVFTNVTKRKLTEERLLLALDKEKELGELKSRFITLASHEFKTPLSTILSSIFFLENYKGEDYEKEKLVHAGRIKRSVNTINTTLNQFLTLEKYYDDEVTITLSVIDISNFINELIVEIEPTKKEGQTIVYQHTGEQLNCTLDQHLLWSILRNLISNALRYSKEESEISIRSSIQEDVLTIVVKDSGIGIPDSEQKDIFGLFYRAANVTNYKGAGLGLHIVEKNVSLLGGTIAFNSKENEGSEFTITLPTEHNVTVEVAH